jgi:magnesium transporter
VTSQLSRAQTTTGRPVTAGDLAVKDVPIAATSTRAGELWEALRRTEFAVTDPVVVCREGAVLGTVSLAEVVRAPADTPVASLMQRVPALLSATLGEEQAALAAVQAGADVLVVVGEDKHLVGLLPAARLLPILLREHEEDLARLSGFMHGAAVARASGEEPVSRRVIHRLPWLIVGLVGAFISADLIGLYEEDLERQVILAFFLPGVVYLADAVGTQTETIVVRSMAVGVPLAGVLRRESVTCLLAGIALALLFLPVSLLRWNDVDVAVAVAISLLAACSIASVVAMTLPWMFFRLGMDPAFGSGPLATVVQDLLSIVTYLLITSALV